MTSDDRTYSAYQDGYSVFVWPDADAVSPRDAGFKNLGMIRIAPERRFERLTSDDPEDMTSLEKMKSEMAEAKDIIALPLYAMAAGDPDSSTGFFQLHSKPFLGDKQGVLVGFVSAPFSDAMAYFGREEMTEDLYHDVLERLADEIMLMNTYLADEVYRFEVHDSNGDVVSEGASIYEAELALDEAMHDIQRVQEKLPSAFKM
ncbi:hypothetical protein [Salipiger mucosus]|uniref:Uncharacterized protein n=1 Tax=Salipiger mucosus DSM 16094 TaxID=1123237 RepID=S9QET8_9RHOB|nr:hypothetical protein [Salipiger mucosus]EPX78068.1 hypothetical protein Salmuc_03390 [Salipiger mucosus DSM 16094]